MPTVMFWIGSILALVWIIFIVDVLKSKREDKTVWTVVVIGLPIVGAVFYSFLAMEKDGFCQQTLKLQWNNMKRPFSNFSLFSYTVFIDVIYFAVIALLAVGAFFLIQYQAAGLQNLDLGSITQSLQQQGIDQSVEDKIVGAVDVMRGFVVFLVIDIIMAMVTILVGF